jgi:hypothetical protein
VIAALHTRRRWRSELPVEAGVTVRVARAGGSVERHEEDLELLEGVLPSGQGRAERTAARGAARARSPVDGGSPKALAGRLDASVRALYDARGCGLRCPRLDARRLTGRSQETRGRLASRG